MDENCQNVKEQWMKSVRKDKEKWMKGVKNDKEQWMKKNCKTDQTRSNQFQPSQTTQTMLKNGRG